jgi:hypothetical protein
MTIGEKRETPIKNDVPAPGSYNPEDSLTRPVSHQRTFSMSKRTEKTAEPEGGPGTYDHQTNFGSDSKQITIGEKRLEKVRNDVPAPGNYNPDESIIKPSSKAADFSKSAGRIDSQ